MNFEWDEIKRQVNIRKHGIDFIDAIGIFDGEILTIEDTRIEYGESRYSSIGLIRDIVIVVVHTETDKLIRIISARKATKNERSQYFQTISNGLEETGNDVGRRN